MRAGVARLVRVGLFLGAWCAACRAQTTTQPVMIRGIYGGYPDALWRGDQGLKASGVNAIWVGSGGLDLEKIARYQKAGVRVFAEFNTLHESAFLEEHPDAAPVGPDGKPSPPPDDWQGICPTHPGYRKWRMAEFRRVLADFPIEGIWLDYHHAHASWEQAEPSLPDTCFCARCLELFEKDAGIELGGGATAERSARLLGALREQWVEWRCGVFTDWVGEFKGIRDEVRPGALLGTFHCPWTDRDYAGALRDKLAIDLKAHAKLVDVMSPMPYHARFGHVKDPEWIGRQTSWLGGHLGLEGKPGERPLIWPIVQLSDWGERVEPGQVEAVLRAGTRAPASGVLVFAWGSLAGEGEKVEALTRFYRALEERSSPSERGRESGRDR
jgi:hypothetical protein